jgi:hypothetical protein
MRRLLQPQLLAWVGVLGSPFAWATQHVAGFALALSRCPDNTQGPGWKVPVNTVTLIFGITAAAVTLLSGASAFAAWRATRENDDDDAPPAGRVHFLAVIGLTITPLFFAIIVMSSTGAIVFPKCVQE